MLGHKEAPEVQEARMYLSTLFVHFVSLCG
jgi:hypothetical protein